MLGNRRTKIEAVMQEPVSHLRCPMTGNEADIF